jgi:GT2 family glycosyltransferase
MIHIVIPVHNRKELTRQCLACLAEQTYRNFSAIVVDDGSTDGTAEMIQQEFPETVIMTGDGNLWWTEATNWGVRYAQKHLVAGDENFVLTLNDDTLVKPDYLASMLSAYERHKPCLIGSVSVDVDNPDKLEFAGNTFDPYFAGGKALVGKFKHSYKELVKQKEYVASDALPGRGTLIPMEVFDKVGLYDTEHFAHYMSDFEFSVRAKKAGYQLIVDTKCLVYEFTRDTGIFLNQKVSWNDFIKSFTSIKSPTNLKVRYHFAITHSKTKIVYFLFDVSRICAGFLRRKLRPM